MKKPIYVLLSLLFISPICIYFYQFNFQLSNDSSDWSAFGSYIGGIYGAIGFFAIVYSIYVTRNQFTIQSEDAIFYKAVDNLKSGKSFRKNFVHDFNNQLISNSSHIARLVLCNKSGIIEKHLFAELLYSINESSSIVYNEDELKGNLSNTYEFEQKWEYLKGVLGYKDKEKNKIKKILNKIAWVTFYKNDFSHRKYFYEKAWDELSEKYSEEINLFLKKIDFIFLHINDSYNSKKYKQFLFSQVSKYDIVFMYLFQIIDNKKITPKVKIEFLKQVYTDECRNIIFDKPSIGVLANELKFSSEN